RPVPGLPGGAAAQHDWQGVLDCGPAAGAPDARRGAVAGAASGADRGVLPAALRAGAESRRVPEQRPEGAGERGGPAARPARGALAHSGVHAPAAPSPATRHELLPSPIRPVCRSEWVTIFLARVIIRASS